MAIEIVDLPILVGGLEHDFYDLPSGKHTKRY
jgi:hypothetical protein